jgi:hypothetical protein
MFLDFLSSQLQVPAALLPVKGPPPPGTHYTGTWVGSRASLAEGTGEMS